MRQTLTPWAGPRPVHWVLITGPVPERGGQLRNWLVEIRRVGIRL